MFLIAMRCKNQLPLLLLAAGLAAPAESATVTYSVSLDTAPLAGEIGTMGMRLGHWDENPVPGFTQSHHRDHFKFLDGREWNAPRICGVWARSRAGRSDRATRERPLRLSVEQRLRAGEILTPVAEEDIRGCGHGGSCIVQLRHES
jgi:hypothetical protein